MILSRILSPGKQENRVVDDIGRHIDLLCTACETFARAMENEDRKLMASVNDLERDGDSIRREIISRIYGGAFLPYLRPDLCRFVEILDDVFDLLKDTAFFYVGASRPEVLKAGFARVAFLNQRMCEMLSLGFRAVISGGDLREKTLAIRIYEKKVDDIKYDLFEDARKLEIESFWEGRMLADLISTLTSISDRLEDASDHLQIINLSLR